MNSLIDKIKNFIILLSKDCSLETKSVLEDIVGEIEVMEDEATFEEIALILKNHLSGTQYYGNYKIIASSDSVELLKLKDEV